MKLIKYDKQWDFHREEHFLYIEGDDFIATYALIYADWGITLSGIYVNPDNRGKGIFNDIMDSVLEYIKDDIYIIVLKGSTIIKKYETYGFEYYSDYEDEFIWMLKD